MLPSLLLHYLWCIRRRRIQVPAMSRLAPSNAMIQLGPLVLAVSPVFGSDTGALAA